MKHGIAIREKKTHKLVDFIECETGRGALTILSGVRRDMSSDYYANETFIEEKEIEEIE